MVLEKVFFFLSFSHYKSMGANDPRVVAGLGPMGLIGVNAEGSTCIEIKHY